MTEEIIIEPVLASGSNYNASLVLLNDVDMLKKEFRSVANSFVSIGYYLNKIKENESFSSLGYSDIYEFASDNFGVGTTSTKNFINVFKRFAEINDYGCKIKSNYSKFNFSQLVELLPVPEADIEKYDPK